MPRRCPNGDSAQYPVLLAGELALRPGRPSIFRGYPSEPGRYARCFADGRCLTGGLARRDGDGSFWFVVAVHERLHVDIPEVDYPRPQTLDDSVGHVAARVPAWARGEVSAVREEPGAPPGRASAKRATAP